MFSFGYLLKMTEIRYKLGRLYDRIFGCPIITGYDRKIEFKKFSKRLRFETALDAGCGDGDYAIYLATKYPGSQIDGCSNDEGSIAQCKEALDKRGLANANFFVLDLLEMDICERYGLIYCIHVLEHIRNNRKVLENFYRALREGGILYINMPTKQQNRIFNERYFEEHIEWAKKEHIGQTYTLETLAADLRQLGFIISKAKVGSRFCSALAWELAHFIKHRRYLPYLLAPLLKTLYHVDSVIPCKSGNDIIIVARKFNILPRQGVAEKLPQYDSEAPK